jgi:hypothetical protein
MGAAQEGPVTLLTQRSSLASASPVMPMYSPMGMTTAETGDHKNEPVISDRKGGVKDRSRTPTPTSGALGPYNSALRVPQLAKAGGAEEQGIPAVRSSEHMLGTSWSP